MVLALSIEYGKIVVVGPQKDGGSAITATDGHLNGVTVDIRAALVFKEFGAVFFHDSPSMRPIVQIA
jgi:hypothetical protein